MSKLIFYQFFEMKITLLQDAYYFRIKRFGGFRRQPLDHLLQRQGTPILAVRGQGVEVIHGRENAGTDRDFFTSESEGIASAVPLLVVGTNNRHHRIRE